jgi:hypothetical protein
MHARLYLMLLWYTMALHGPRDGQIPCAEAFVRISQSCGFTPVHGYRLGLFCHVPS